jgi:hypothetical protein
MVCYRGIISKMALVLQLEVFSFENDLEMINKNLHG